MNQIAERLRDHRTFMHSDLVATDRDVLDAPLGLPVAARRALEKLKDRSRRPAGRRVGGRIERVAEQQPIGVCGGAGGRQGRLVQLVEMVKHGSTSRLRYTFDAASRNQMVILCCNAMTV